MNGVEILLIIGAGIAISAVARRYRIEPGLVIVVLAAAASFIPGIPRLELESEWILAIVVPPLLYSATRGASFAGFGANLRATGHHFHRFARRGDRVTAAGDVDPHR